jgi:hypothetical protein
MMIRIKKKTDGDAALSCERADGTVTWQRQEGQLGRFFPLHDLTHYAVESVLGFREAFYGLIASGWNIADFSGTGLQQRLPPQALLAETLVAFFDLERRTGERGDAEGFNEHLATHYAERRMTLPSFRITDDQIASIRASTAELFDHWDALPPGETLELPFE